jgi:hypothetical protein
MFSNRRDSRGDTDAADSCIRVICVIGGFYNRVLRKRRAFVITETELNVIAAPAIIGLRSHPQIGYKTPAAIGMPKRL